MSPESNAITLAGKEMPEAFLFLFSATNLSLQKLRLATLTGTFNICHYYRLFNIYWLFY
jgi:hypothetical protein